MRWETKTKCLLRGIARDLGTAWTKGSIDARAAGREFSAVLYAQLCPKKWPELDYAKDE